MLAPNESGLRDVAFGNINRRNRGGAALPKKSFGLFGDPSD